jgi:acetylornithine deacetylase/succinyl-diaminopimelate desuccinylase-like protein
VRGLAYLEVEVRGPASDLHSGTWGGLAPNPANALATMLAALKDGEGRVTVPGFYDRVVPLAPLERERLAALPFDEARVRKAVGSRELPGEPGFTLLERQWTRPTLDVNGLSGGFAGEGAKTVIPAVARAKLSCRLVPDQDPREIGDLVAAALRAAAPSWVDVTVRQIGAASPAVVSLDHPAIGVAAEALTAAYGREAVFTRSGGTVPAVGAFTKVLGLPTIMVGFGLPDARAHAPNEFLLLDNFERGPEALVRLWDGLSGGALRRSR